MGVDPANKMINKAEGRIEKYMLRSAFDDKENPYLPDRCVPCPPRSPWTAAACVTVLRKKLS